MFVCLCFCRSSYESDSFPGEVLKMLEVEGVSLSDVEPAPLDVMYVSICVNKSSMIVMNNLVLQETCAD